MSYLLEGELEVKVDRHAYTPAKKGSLPALMTAVQASGLAVKDADGSIARKPAEPKQGVAFQAGELFGIQKLEERG